MQKNFYQVQQSAVKYRFSIRTLSDRNVKIDCHVIFFLERLNLVPRGLYHFRYNTQFPRDFGRFTRKSAETFILRKILSPRKLDEKAGILRRERMEIIIHFRKNMMAQSSFYY